MPTRDAAPAPAAAKAKDKATGKARNDATGAAAAHPGPAARGSAGKPAGKPASPAQQALRRLGLVRDIDLALHLPLRWEDETRITPMAGLRDGDSVQVEGTVREARVELRPRRQLVARIADGGGSLVLRLLHWYPAQQRQLVAGARVRARGEVRHGFLGPEIVHPAWRVVDAGTPLPATLTPVYPASAQLPQAYLRKAVASALARADLRELLPPDALPTLPTPPDAATRALPALPPLKDALALLHQPPPHTPLAALDDRSHPAWQRLKFEELLAQQLSQHLAQQERARLRAPVLAPAAADGSGLVQRLRAALPFALTGAQARVAAEIAADLARAQPMNRLLQGDVGSGKTVVAALAAAAAIEAGWQCALMAPTELLADQHFRKLVAWLEPLSVRTAWLTGSRKGRARQAMQDAVAEGTAQLVVGTQAVIQEGVAFARLGLAIVDEQHRFGVQQRLALRHKLAAAGGHEGLEPHLLMMSATPIPRTLAMTYFADLDVSTLDELPPGRTPVATRVFGDAKRGQVVERVRDEVARGRQVYWVCPLVEESEHVDLKNATETHAELAAALPGHAGQTVGLLHGRMAAAEKAAVMAEFSAGRMPVLVATTVIEVGVDVPQASCMVIEHAERFGLAQLHQLRGRVGRGSTASVCVLLYSSPLSDAGKERLKAMAETADGFEIARRDLAIRGPGEFLGLRQSGDALLRFADLQEDDALLQHARRVAPLLLREHPDAARAHVARWLEGREEFLKA